MRTLHTAMSSATLAKSTSDSPWSFDRAAIIGAGSMGTLLASVLGKAVPTIMVCRNAERAGQLFRFGANSQGPISAESRPIVVRTFEDMVDAGGATAIFVATKTTALPALAKELRPVLAKLVERLGRVYVVSFQNGIDPGRELVERLGHPDVLRMVLTLGVILDEDGGCANVTLHSGPHAIGSIDPKHRDVCCVIADVLSTGGLETKYVEDIESAVWCKGIINAAVNPVAALGNCSVGDVLDSPAHVIFKRLLHEGIAVAQAEGITLPTGYQQKAEVLAALAHDHVPSMVEDIRRGRESEVGQLNNQIMQHGRRLGVPTPTHEIIAALIETFDWKVFHHRGASAPEPVVGSGGE